MFALYANVMKGGLRFGRGLSKLSRFAIAVSEEVKEALHFNKPIVALESTIITHGMPYPENVNCALEVEEVVRKEGAIPATIAIIKGQITVGIDANQTNFLGDVQKSEPIKTSRRDLAYVISGARNGGTTVSGTLVVANKIGIPLFATGGIGGVHRGGELTFDISADLTELGKSGVAVVSSGVKSILDIPKTLEYLETQGVFVATMSYDKHFPAFYSRRSGSFAPYSVGSVQEAAKIIHCNRSLDLNSGMLFAVPVPEKFALDESVINGVIEQALKDAENGAIGGKEITPFLLGRIAEITTGKSLETNISLIKNNASTAAKIAVELSKLGKNEGGSNSFSKEEEFSNSPVVIGGSNLDFSIKLQTEEIKLDGRIHFGKSKISGGGVARNICDSLSKLGCRPFFISAVGNDPLGALLKNFIPEDNQRRVKVLEDCTTAICAVVLDNHGECRFLSGDLRIHQHITPQMILENEEILKRAPLIVFDANLSIPTIETILKTAQLHNVPVLFEPTDVEVSIKPFQTNHWKAIKIITPNLNELKSIASYLKIHTAAKSQKIDEVVEIASKLVDFIDVIIVTLGKDGVVIARKGSAHEPLLKSKCGQVQIRHYVGDKNKKVVNVSGAGDNLASGLVAATLKGLTEEECFSVGLQAAECAISVTDPVPETLFTYKHEAWKKKALYKTLLD